MIVAFRCARAARGAKTEKGLKGNENRGNENRYFRGAKGDDGTAKPREVRNKTSIATNNISYTRFKNQFSIRHCICGTSRTVTKPANRKPNKSSGFEQTNVNANRGDLFKNISVAQQDVMFSN